jgi:hypothetical protein
MDTLIHDKAVRRPESDMRIATIDLIVKVNDTGSCYQSNVRPAVELVSDVDACACPEQDIRRTIVDLVT